MARRIRRCGSLLIGAACALLGVGPIGAQARAPLVPPAPSAEQCAAGRAHRSLPPIQALDPLPHAPRFFAMQFKEDAANVVTYESFRIKIECLIREDVVPLRAKRRPNVVSFNEDTGLASIATGTRGAAARNAFAEGSTVGCEGQRAPCGALGALGAITAAHPPPLPAYPS